jgi:hypothetical protein
MFKPEDGRILFLGKVVSRLSNYTVFTSHKTTARGARVLKI